MSEGRRGNVIKELADTIRAVQNVKLLDVCSDADHNRTVFTFIGPPEAVMLAAQNLTESTVTLIDIEAHEGVHPFIGAVDVIPFVPLMGVSREEVVEFARGLGSDISHKFNLPVYFYGYAALRHDRSELPEVRKGGYHALKDEISHASRHPDYGEAKLHPRAGAVAIGVRDFLIAFNINLDSNDLEAAKEIAKNVRAPHGGLPGLRAIGVPLKSRGIVQVSMNITDHRETTLKEVFDLVSERASNKGLRLLESELVGLIPADAVFPKMKEYLKLKHFDDRKILNNYL